MKNERGHQLWLFVSGIKFDRELSRPRKASTSIKTTIFPRTIEEGPEQAFYKTHLKSVVLNAGLENLAGHQILDEGYKDCYIGAFAGTLLRHVTLPATLQVLGDGVFCGCASLRSVTFAEGSQLRKIGTGCFVGCGLEEFVAPPSLRTIGQGAFKQCRDLKRVVLNEGLKALEEYRYEYETRYSHYCNGIF